MKIFINDNYEIKALNESNDINLTEIEVDRELVFGELTDFMILNYCYKDDEKGFSIYPATTNYHELLKTEIEYQLENLRKENRNLKRSLLRLGELVSEEEYNNICNLYNINK